MCTVITLGGAFGRNMDIDRSFGERAVFVPRFFPLHFKRQATLSEHYAFMGTAALIKDYPLFAEGLNEKGLFVASLNFSQNAYYKPPNECIGAVLAPYEVIPYLLALCSSTDEAAALLEKTQLADIPYAEGLPVATLHYFIADKDRCIVFESTRQGCHIYENPTGVMTNDPTFPEQLKALSASSATSPYILRSEPPPIKGDFSSKSRFQKAAYLLHLSDKVSPLIQARHILGAVSIPRGAAYDGDNLHYTTYQCIADINGSYIYYTYNSLTPISFNLFSLQLDHQGLTLLT